MAVPAPVTPRRGQLSLALAVLCLLLFLTFLDNTIVSVTLGSIQEDLHAGVSSLQWVVNAYALPFASVMLACGMIGDELGRKKVMLGGAGVFCAGSVLCATAPSVGVLIAGRVVMGLGAAASEPGTLSLLRHLYTDEPDRNRAIGVWAAVSGLALALGPVIGGTLVGAWDWRAIFWFNLAFGLVALTAAATVLPESADPGAGRVDTAGSLIGAAALAALVFAVITGESAGYGSAQVVVLFAVAAAGAVAFVERERRARHPLLDLRYLRVPRFSVAALAAFCTYFGTLAIFFFVALYLDEVVGDSGFRIALVFLPMTALMIGASLAAGPLTTRLGPRWLVLAGCAVFAAGLVLTDVVLRPDPDQAALGATLALAGLGIGTTVVPITSSALSAVPPERSGMASSATNTSREMGAVIGVAVLGALVNATLRHDLLGRLRQLGVPPTFQEIVIRGVETGAVPSSGRSPGGAAAAAGAGHGGEVQQVIDAAYTAFHSGLRDALLLSAVLVAIAGVLCAALLEGRHRSVP
ncbi:MAG TPA: MFS transporter [Acidimicrobiales bacterium]|nr:MFS transporter [Acidimicrobiales bacterium]